MLVKNVEKRIWDIEGFSVVIRDSEGRDIRGDRMGLPSYSYDRAAKHNITVAAWKESRFYSNYPGLLVDVLDGLNNTATGNTLLSTVRDSYSEED